MTRAGTGWQQAGHRRWVPDAQSLMARLAPSPVGPGLGLRLAAEGEPGEAGSLVEGGQGYEPATKC